MRRFLLVLTLPLLLAAAPASAAPAPSPLPPADISPSPAPGSSPPPAALWTTPVAPLRLSRPFEPLPHPYAAGHRGVDLLGSPGAVIVAAGDGLVAFAGRVAGRPVVSVDHADGLRTTYEPVEPSVAAGHAVARGSPLGVLVAGHAGCPVEACLHWGLRRGETYLDPLALLRLPRVRLLPFG